MFLFIRVSIVASCLLFLLAACGGGGSGGSGSPSAFMPPVVIEPDPPPVQEPEQAPIPPSFSLHESNHQTIIDHNNAIIRYGEIPNGISGSKVKDFLHVMNGGVVFRHTDSPLISLAEGTTDHQQQYAEEAIALVNAALPYDFKIRLSSGRVPARQRANVPNGQIYLEFAPRQEWQLLSGSSGTAVGTTQYSMFRIHPDRPEEARFSSQIWIDSDWLEGTLPSAPSNGRDRRGAIPILLSHELLHAMGFTSHVPDELPLRFISIMMGNQLPRISEGADEPKRILSPLDRDGLLALYGRLNVGDSPNDLGPWNTTATRIRGDRHITGDQWVSFGAETRNSFVSPWAAGPPPNMALEANTALSGNVSWSGQAVGFTMNKEALMGNVGLTINLSTLTGDLEFDGLEYWTPDTAPGHVGSGIIWNDGDLAYSVRVFGNTFQRTSGDEGIVTGSFYGSNHEAMGGTLDHPDMAVGFGGVR